MKKMETLTTADCRGPLRSAAATTLWGNVSARRFRLAGTPSARTDDPRTAERLAEYAVRLVRQNEALEDFAGLVAHDLRTVLVAGLRSGSTRESLTRALQLVDSILEAVHADSGDGNDTASVPDCVRDAALDIGDSDLRLVCMASGSIPMAPTALRYVLRNLMTNAVAAGADLVQVSALACGDQHLLAVDDNGGGPGASTSYVAGVGLGLALCRRVLGRCGGTLELRPGLTQGSRALICLAGGAP